MRDLLHSLKRLPLSQQLALTASALCFAATLTLVALAGQSSRYTQENLQSAYGTAVAQQLASRLSAELVTGDRLGVASELARLIQQPSIAAARALDVDDVEIAVAGDRTNGSLSFRAPIRIAGDVAGATEVFVNTDEQDAARVSFLAVLSGLALVLSIVVYGVTHTLAKRLAQNLQAVSSELAQVTGTTEASANELLALKAGIAALPLELLTPQAVDASHDEHWVDTAILFIHLRSLPGYLDTVDERRLHNYVAAVHRLFYGAAGFYQGELEVTRQFGVAIWFNGPHKVGSPALRAASCAWLIRQAAPEIEASLRLSVGLGLAVGGSELGRGDAKDMYPGLYTQAAVDELESLARANTEGVTIAPFVANDIDLTTRAGLEKTASGELQLGVLADGHRDLLERQRQILLNALLKPAEASADQTP